MKRLLSGLMALMLIASSVLLAADTEKLTSKNQKIDELSQFLYALEYDAEAYDMTASDFDKLYIGKPIPAYEMLDTGATPMAVEYYPIFTADDRLVMIARVLDTDGQLVMTVSNDFVLELQPFYEGAAPIALVFDKSLGYIISGGTAQELKTASYAMVNNRAVFKAADASALELKNEVVEKTTALTKTDPVKQSIIETPMSRAIPIQSYITVTGYAQQRTLSCWAACVRSIGKYYTNITKTEAQIYSYCGITYNNLNGGTVTDAQDALDGLYGVYASTYNFHGYMSFAAYCSIIYAGYPMFAETYPSVGGTGHAIVLRGYYDYQSSSNVGIINFMDPATGNNTATNVQTNKNYHYINGNGVTAYMDFVLY